MTPPGFTPDNERVSIFRAAVTQSHMSDDALDELSQVRHNYIHDIAVTHNMGFIQGERGESLPT